MSPIQGTLTNSTGPGPSRATWTFIRMFTVTNGPLLLLKPKAGDGAHSTGCVVGFETLPVLQRGVCPRRVAPLEPWLLWAAFRGLCSHHAAECSGP